MSRSREQPAVGLSELSADLEPAMSFGCREGVVR